MDYLLDQNSNVENIINIFQITNSELLKDEKKCWELLIEGKFSNAMKIVGDLFWKLEKLLNNISLIESEQNIKINEIDMNELLLKMEEAIGKHDYVLLSDLMEYELKQILITWSDAVKSLNGEKYSM